MGVRARRAEVVENTGADERFRTDALRITNGTEENDEND